MQPTAPLVGARAGNSKRAQLLQALMNSIMGEAKVSWALQRVDDVWRGVDDVIMCFGFSTALEMAPHIGLCPIGQGVVGAGALQILMQGSVKVVLISGDDFLKLCDAVFPSSAQTPQQAVNSFKQHKDPSGLWTQMQTMGLSVYHGVQSPDKALWVPPGYMSMMAMF